MKILVFGDSYGFGSGCSDVRSYDLTTNDKFSWDNYPPSKFSWVSYINDLDPNAKVLNYSRPGIDNLSLAEMVWQNISDDADVIVFNGSFNNRFQLSQMNTDDLTESVLINYNKSHYSPKFQKAIEYFYRYLYNDKVGVNYSAATILSVYSCAQMKNLKFLWSLPELQPDVPAVLKEIEKYRFSSCADFNYKENEIAPCRHPNEIGNRRYFLEVIEPFFKKHIFRRD